MEVPTPPAVGLFLRTGGVMVSGAGSLSLALEGVRALVFDWDGVFNAGRKGAAVAGTFSEADSMGLNMLRYGMWRRSASLASVAIVSGEHDDTVTTFARREHLDAVYLGASDKREALQHLCDERGVAANEVLVMFDDVNDLAMAEICGVRIMVGRTASPLLRDFVTRHQLCDYITANDGASFAVREMAELVLGMTGLFDEVVRSRMAFDDEYRTYLAARRAVAMTTYGVDSGDIVAR